MLLTVRRSYEKYRNHKKRSYDNSPPRKDNQNMKTIRVSSLSVLLIAVASLLIATGARATVVDLTTSLSASGSINGATLSFC